MNYNLNSGYGMQLAHYLPQGIGGKLFMVAKSEAAGRDMLQQLFIPDTDGINRYAATIDAAIGYTTASRGDVILVAPGHTESVTGASGITLDVAGVTIIGLGVGNNRPVITFSSSTAASFDITASNCRVKNLVGVAGIDGLTKPFLVSGDNCELDVEWQDASSAVEAATAVRLDTANNSQLKLKYLGFTAGNATTSAVLIDDCDNVRIDIDGYGVVSTAWVNMVDFASTNVVVNGNLYTQGITNFTRDVVDTITGSTWSATIFDASAGYLVSGGSASALAADDVSAIAGQVTTILGNVSGTDAATNVLGADDADNQFASTNVTANRDGTVLERLEQIIAAQADDVATNALGFDDANNVFSSSSVVANVDGSLLERDEALQVAAAPSKNHPNYFTVTADMTSATWNTVAAHEIAVVTGVCRLQILVETTATIITTGTNGTMALGYEGNTSAIFSATALDAALTGDIWTAVYGSAATTVVGGADAQSALTHSIFDVVVVNGADVGYTIATNAATTGTLTFHVWWEPLSATGAVTAGAGGPF